MAAAALLKRSAYVGYNIRGCTPFGWEHYQLWSFGRKPGLLI